MGFMPIVRMTHGTYVGENRILRDKKAMIAPTDDPKEVLVQFDDQDLQIDAIHYAYGWHRFNRFDFVFDDEVKP